jgi:hypothetical protein
MFVLAANVQFRLEDGSDGATSTFEFGVTEDGVDWKAAFAIDAVDFGESLDKRLFFAVAEHSCSNELYASGNGQEERNFVHKHEIDTERDVVVLIHDLSGNVRETSLDAVEAAARRFAFEGANAASKNVCGVDGVLAVNWAVRDGDGFEMANEVLEFGPSYEDLGFTSYLSTRVVSIGIIRLFIGYSTDQNDVIGAAGSVEVVETATQLLE